MTNTLDWKPPGPGSWELDRVHTPRPGTRFVSEVLPAAFAEGFGETFARYGMLLKSLRMEKVNGFTYGTQVPIAPEEFPERLAAAAETLETRRWRTDHQRWESEVKPDSRRRNHDLAAVDLAGLDDAALAAYVTRSRDNLALMITRHHQFNGAAMLPIGDLLVHGAQWGLAAPEILGLFKGASPISGGECEETAALVGALQDDPEAQSLVEGPGDPAATIDALLARSGAVGDAMRRFVAFVGLRPLDGFDICEPTAMERPEVLLVALRHALARPRAALDLTGVIAGLRDRVPADHRATFDELLSDALLTYRVRDERGVYQDAWAYGLVRRALLEAGRRLASSGRLETAEHLVEAGCSEVVSLLTAGTGPSAEELATRFRSRMELRPELAPDLIGDPPSPPPSMDDLPPPVARVMGAFMTAIAHLFATTEEKQEGSLVRGFPVGTGSYEGTARVLSGPSDLWRIEEGDVLVTASTTESFNLVLPILGAIVTDHGGMLSHAAIVSREYGLPCVVGCREATTFIPDGARVRVDGDKGEVHLLS